jgi:hypothetical protein
LNRWIRRKFSIDWSARRRLRGLGCEKAFKMAVLPFRNHVRRHAMRNDAFTI